MTRRATPGTSDRLDPERREVNGAPDRVRAWLIAHLPPFGLPAVVQDNPRWLGHRQPFVADGNRLRQAADESIASDLLITVVEAGAGRTALQFDRHLAEDVNLWGPSWDAHPVVQKESLTALVDGIVAEMSRDLAAVEDPGLQQVADAVARRQGRPVRLALVRDDGGISELYAGDPRTRQAVAPAPKTRRGQAPAALDA